MSTLAEIHAQNQTNQGQVAWAIVKNHMRKRLTRIDAENWLEPARMLRVLKGDHNFFLDIPELFRTCRGSNYLCTVLDFAILQEWADAGLDPRAVYLGIQDVFQNYPQPAADGIHSISFCRNAIFKRQSLLNGARIGSSHAIEDQVRYTLLIGLPRRGEAIYRAIAHHKPLRDCASRHINPYVSVALTVQPDERQLSRLPAGFLGGTPA